MIRAAGINLENDVEVKQSSCCSSISRGRGEKRTRTPQAAERDGIHQHTTRADHEGNYNIAFPADLTADVVLRLSSWGRTHASSFHRQDTGYEDGERTCQRHGHETPGETHAAHDHYLVLALMWCSRRHTASWAAGTPCPSHLPHPSTPSSAALSRNSLPPRALRVHLIVHPMK